MTRVALSRRYQCQCSGGHSSRTRQKQCRISNGVYIKLENVDDAVNKIRSQLDTIEKSPLEDAAFRDYNSYYYWFIVIALLFLMIEFLWPEIKWKTA